MARLEIQIGATNVELKKILKESKDLLSQFSNAFDVKPLTAYQAGLLKLKKETLDLAKAKQDQAKADKEASSSTKKALDQEKLTRSQLGTQAAKNASDAREATRLAKEQAEALKKVADAARKAKDFPTGFADRQFQTPPKLGSSDPNAKLMQLLNEEFRKGVINAKQFGEEVDRLKAKIAANSQATKEAANSTREGDNATKNNAKSKRELAIALELEKQKQQEAANAIRAYAKEQNAAKGSIEQRKLALERLTLAYSKLNEAERASAAGQRLAGIIAGLKNQVNSLNPSLNNQVGLFDSLKNQLIGVALGYASLQVAMQALKSVVHNNIEISDSLTDVQRTAKLTEAEVTSLADEFRKLDTRTSLAGLLDVGFIGGRLGVAKKDLFSFTKTVDELAVVLRKELPGGAEAVAESLGKIASVYKVVQNEGIPLEQALRKIGGAFLDLSHTGPVTVKYLQDFTLGVAGSAASAKLSLPVIGAYGAVMSEAGIIASSAAISFTRLVGELSTKRFKYFAIAQLGDATLTIEKFTHLINTDTKSALDAFFKGLKAGNPTQVEFTERVKSLGFTTGKVTNAIKVLAENQDKLTEKLKVGTKGYEDASSIAHNFELVNNNLASSVDKLGNSISNLTNNPNSNLAKFFKGIVDNANFAVTAISDLQDALAKTQAQKDDELIRQNTPGQFKFSDLGSLRPAADPKELAAARARRKARGTASLTDEITGQGNTRADILASGKDEIQIRRLLTGEIYKQQQAQKRLNYTLAYIKDPKNVIGPLDAQRSKVNKLRVDLVKQDAVVARLRSKLPKTATITGDGSIDQDGNERTITDIENDIKRVIELKKPLSTASAKYKEYVKQLVAFKKELKIAKGIVPKTPAAPAIQKTSADVLAKSTATAAISEEDGVNKTLEKLKQRYIGYYDELDKLALKKGADRNKIESDRAIIKANEIREMNQIDLAETKRVESEKTRILAEADVKNAEGFTKEIAAADKKYAEEIVKANGNQLLLSAITEAAERTREKIHKEYADKKIEAEQKVYDKISDITEKGFTDNVKRTVQGSARIDAQLKERLSALQKYFDELRKLNEGNPLGVMALNVQQEGEARKLTGAANAAKSPDRSTVVIDDLKKNLESVGASLVSGLRNAEGDFKTIFGNVVHNFAGTLTDELNNIFAGQLKNTLNDLVSGVKISTTQALSSIAGVLGGVISGATKKTSFVGQGAGGALTGAATGVVAGAALGPGGALIGGVIGGVVGLLGGIFGAGKARKQEALQKKQLEEQKKQTALMERQNALAYASSIIGRNTTSGIVTGVDVNEFGQVITKVSGSDLLIIHDKAVKSRQRGV